MSVLRDGAELKENLGVAANRRAKQGNARCFGKEIGNVKGEAACEEGAGCPVARPATADLQLCLPYAEQIRAYLLARESASLRAGDYFSRQPHINENMRAVLVDWLVDVGQRFKLQSQTVFLAVGLLDRYLATHAAQRNRLQLIGVSCLMTIGKYEEIYPPTLADYVAVCDNAYATRELLETESAVLLALHFELNRPTPLTFLQCFQAALPLPPRPLHYCQYLLESALVDSGHLSHAGSALAAGALFLICKLFDGCSWTSEHERVCGVSAAQAKGCARELYRFMHRNEQLRLSAVKRKFASAQFSEVARYKIERVTHD